MAMQERKRKIRVFANHPAVHSGGISMGESMDVQFVSKVFFHCSTNKPIYTAQPQESTIFVLIDATRKTTTLLERSCRVP